MANSELKRVGIVFDADGTVDFKNSLKSVSAELKNNQNEFAKTKAAYDENTSSVKKLQDQYSFCTKQAEAYRQKTELLRGSLDELKKREAENYDALQKKRAETEKLKKELEDLKKAENADADAIAKKTAEYNKASGELEKLVKTENDYNSKIASSQTNLDAATLSMDKFRQAADDANKSISDGSARLDDAQKKLEKFSDKSGKLGSAMTKGITAPIAAAAAGSIAAYKTIDDAEDKITKMVGTSAAGDAIEQYHKLFTSSNGFESSDIADAVGEINTRFGVQGDELYNLSETWLKFARATDSDIVPSVDSAQKVVDAFNLSLTDTPALLDAVTAAGQNSGLSTQTILDDLVKYGPALKSAGLDAGGAIKFLVGIEKSGADLDTVMTGLNKALVYAMNNGMTLFDALKEMFKNASSADAVVELFGNRGGAVIAQMLEDGTLTQDMFSGIQGGLNDTLGTVDDVDSALHGADEDIQAVMNNITDAGAQIGSALMPMIADVLQMVVPFLKDFSAWWNGLNDDQKKMIVKLAGIAAAIGPVITGISKISGGLASLIGKDGTIRKIAAALGPVRTGISNISGVLASLMGEGGIISKVGSMFSSGISLFSSGISAVSGGISTLIGGIGSLIRTGGSMISSAIAFLGPQGLIIAGIAAAVAAVVLLYQNCEGFRDFVNGILPGIASVFSAIWDWIVKFGEGIGELWEEILKPFFSSVGEFFSDLFSNKLEQIKSFFGSIGDFFTGLYNGATNILGSLWDWITSGVTGTLNTISGIIDGFMDVFRKIYDTVSGWISSISEGVQGAFSWAGGIAGNVADFFTGGKTTKTGKARWFADGGILTRPTVFANSGGTPFIGGESGNEAILPIDNLVGYMSQVNQSQTAELVGAMRDAVAAGVLSALRKYAPEVSLDGEAVGSIVDGRIRRAMG